MDKDSVKYGLGFGAVASLANIFLLIPVYGQLTFHLGQAFVILCLLARGFKAALIAGLLSISILTVTIDNLYFFVLLLLEIIFLHKLRQKGQPILIGIILYWVFIGVPLSFAIIFTQTNFPLDYTALVLLKQLINGILYTLIAGILLLFLPEQFVSGAFKSTLPTMSSRILYLASVCIILPALLVALLFTSRATSDYQVKVKSDLAITSQQISYLINSHIDVHLSVIKNLAANVANLRDKESALTETQQAFPGFITMLIADKDGNIEFGTPAAFYDVMLSAPAEQRHVKDRTYFLEPRLTQEPYVSEVFRGRGFGNDMIVAISAPVIEQGEFKGIIEGSLHLPSFSSFEKQLEFEDVLHHLVVTDRENRVVFASKDVPVKVLDIFTPESKENLYAQDMFLTRLQSEEFLYLVNENAFGWKTYVLAQPRIITRIFNENLVILVVTLLAVSAMFMFITRRFTKQITGPLESLVQVFSDNKNNRSRPPIRFETLEVKEIASQLSHAKQLMDAFNQKLEDQVKSKTAELSELNKELELLARQDELTGLANRRAFDEQARQVFQVNCRNQQQMTLVAIDIDHFKNLNDTYGHPFGDTCLVNLAKNIDKHFNRTSDICARYGGEEFVMLLAGGNCKSHLKQLEYFRQAVESTQQFFQNEAVNFTVSLGAVCVEEDFNQSFDALMEQADNFLYQSKENGRNCLNKETI